MARACKLQPGHLNTRDERRQLRLLADDLQRQLERCHDPEQATRLADQIESIKREQQYDRQVSPRVRKPKKAGRQ